jgi:hypothetical protein
MSEGSRGLILSVLASPAASVKAAATRWLRGQIRDACIEGHAATPIRKIATKV